MEKGRKRWKKGKKGERGKEGEMRKEGENEEKGENVIYFQFFGYVQRSYPEGES